MPADNNNKNSNDMGKDDIPKAGHNIDVTINSADETLQDAFLQASYKEDDVVDAINDPDSEGGTNSAEIGPETPQQTPSGPGKTAIAVGAAGITMLFAPALVALPALSLVGFGASGPIAGGIAAAVQSGIGSVVAPSLFATLQSAAMGGYGAAAVFGTVQAAGGVITAATAAQVARNNQRA